MKSVRKHSGLSQRELAKRAGMTNGAVSLIEQNKTSPSIASLKSLLDAIPISMAEFFSSFEAPQPQKIFFKAAELTELAPQDSEVYRDASPSISLRQLGVAADHSLQMLHETYPAQSDTGQGFLTHEGEEAGIVISGTIEITVGDEICVLEAGDGYIFDSQIPHRFRNAGAKECVIVSACTPPTF